MRRPCVRNYTHIPFHASIASRGILDMAALPAHTVRDIVRLSAKKALYATPMERIFCASTACSIGMAHQTAIMRINGRQS